MVCRYKALDMQQFELWWCVGFRRASHPLRELCFSASGRAESPRRPTLCRHWEICNYSVSVLVSSTLRPASRRGLGETALLCTNGESVFSSASLRLSVLDGGIRNERVRFPFKNGIWLMVKRFSCWFIEDFEANEQRKVRPAADHCCDTESYVWPVKRH